MENIYHKRNNSVDAIIYANNTSFLATDKGLLYALCTTRDVFTTQ